MLEILLPAIIAVVILLFVTVFIFFDNPKPYNWRELGRYSYLYKTSLCVNASPTEVIFKTLKEAGIGPCFLNADLKK